MRTIDFAAFTPMGSGCLQSRVSESKDRQISLNPLFWAIFTTDKTIADFIL
jgi:hypothetical protein